MNEFKSFDEIPRSKRIEPVKTRDTIPIYEPKKKETVVNSELIKWKPIDAVARRVIAKAPWYCQPPDEPPMKFNKQATPDDPDPIQISDKRYLDERKDYNAVKALASSVLTREKTIEAAETLVVRAREATAAIEHLSSAGVMEWETFDAFTKKALSDARQTRLALEMETRLIMTELREVRTFFLEDKHEQEMVRLREFVSLCHQLHYLKKSGFLDIIADTILKLSEVPKPKSE